MGEVSQLIQIVGIGLSLLLPLANPLTSVSLLLSLGGGLSQQERARQVKQATFYVMGIMLVTYYAGMWIMSAFDISMPGMRIAGGMVVAFIGFNMLFPSSSVGDMPEADRAKESMQTHSNPSIAFVPLALPGTAGPGTMAMIISSSSRLVKIVGHDGIDAISRVMGFLLVCMGVQLVINGIEEIVVSATHLAS